MEIMTGFPPGKEHLVTLANWRTPPYNRWAFNHVRELVPSAAVRAHEGVASPTPTAAGLAPIEGFALAWQERTLDTVAWLGETFTDSMVIMKNGETVFEYYAPGQDTRTPHIWMSVSKSVLGLLAGIVVGQGKLDVDSPLTAIIPELKNSAYEGASVRDLLDMRVGVRFDEDYHAANGAIIEYRKSHLWDPVPVGETATDMRSFFSTLKERDGEHGGRFHYVSPNTDILGWVLERASGVRFADLLSDLLWKPLRAGHDAYITVDRYGAPRCAGGFCAVPKDMALLGRLFVTGGRGGSNYQGGGIGDGRAGSGCASPGSDAGKSTSAGPGAVAGGGQQIVPASWIDDIINNGSAQAWRDGDFYDLFGGADMHYRSQWYIQRGERPLIYGVGVFGQNVYVDPAADLVIAKASSQPLPLDESFLNLTQRGIDGLRALLG